MHRPSFPKGSVPALPLSRPPFQGESRCANFLPGRLYKVWGNLYAKHEAKGFNMGIFDSLLGATAISHQLILVTRNTGDFPKEVKTVNPWLE